MNTFQPFPHVALMLVFAAVSFVRMLMSYHWCPNGLQAQELMFISLLRHTKMFTKSTFASLMSLKSMQRHMAAPTSFTNFCSKFMTMGGEDYIIPPWPPLTCLAVSTLVPTLFRRRQPVAWLQMPSLPPLLSLICTTTALMMSRVRVSCMPNAFAASRCWVQSLQQQLQWWVDRLPCTVIGIAYTTVVCCLLYELQCFCISVIIRLMRSQMSLREIVMSPIPYHGLFQTMVLLVTHPTSCYRSFAGVHIAL